MTEEQKELLKNWENRLNYLVGNLVRYLSGGDSGEHEPLDTFVKKIIEAKDAEAKQLVEKTKAEERLRATEILSKYALMTVKPKSLDLIEQAQKEILNNLLD